MSWGARGGPWGQPLRRSCGGCARENSRLGLSKVQHSALCFPSSPRRRILVVPVCHVTFLRQWFSWERLGSPGESEMSQEHSTLRVCVNCFLPGALGREPRRLSQHLEQYKQMPSASSTWKRKMSCLASLNSRGGHGGGHGKEH